jgi:hypothetical protein
MAPTLKQRLLMARIDIKDLPQSDELDREALRSILGGGLRGPQPARDEQRMCPIVDYPPGLGGLGAQHPKARGGA